MADAAIATEQLVKRYGEIEAVRGIDLSIMPGEIFGFLGPNGAGKSTTISMLCTLLRPTSGRAAVAGFDVVRDPGAVPARINEVLEMVELADRATSKVATFSGGMKRRLEIARGILHSPEVLFLDEPTRGLDPQTRSHIWDYLRALRGREGITIFMTTHYMDEAEFCDRIAIMDMGRIVALGTPDELKARVGGDVIAIATTDNVASAGELGSKFGLTPAVDDGMLRIEVSDGAAFIPRLVRDLSAQVTAVTLRRPSLDDVFLKLTGRAIREEQAGALDRMRMMGARWGGRRH